MYIIADTSGRSEYPEAVLQQLGGLQVQMDKRKLSKPDELLAECAAADAMLVTDAWVTREVMEGLPRLKAVVRYGVGMDRIDLQAAEELGVIARNVRDFCTDEVADHSLALLLACARNLAEYVQANRQGLWHAGNPRPMSRLRGSTAGIIGFGAIGQALAARLSALQMRVLCFDPYPGPDAARTLGVEPVDMETLLAASDYTSLNCGLSDETRHLIGPDQLAQMKPTAYLINTSRGEVVDEAALVEALREGRLAGAGLDVLETEPPAADHPLLQMEQVIVTPHVAWYSEQAAEELVVGAFAHLADLLPGFTPGARRRPEMSS
jgi:D-3-phosphoglycerate dehydrogenase / 2-oxoglutarate reductase